MTRAVFVFLFIIFVTIHNTVQLQCPPGEDEDTCPSDCYKDNCPIREQQYRGCSNTGDCGTPRCKCHFNMKRALNGTCIDTRDCPPFKCERPNEEYEACPPLCPTDDCRQSTPDGRCPIYGHMLIVVECTPACRCIKGHWRKEGKCVPYEMCLQLQCPPGEDEDTCPSDCYKDNCPIREQQYRGCSNTGDCGTPRCKCHFNMKRALNGTCIDTRDCPPFKCERPNEEYEACPPLCPTDDCRQSTPDGRCPIYGHMLIVVECTPACRCIKGHWRKEGKCVPYEMCPQHASTPHLPIFFG